MAAQLKGAEDVGELEGRKVFRLSQRPALTLGEFPIHLRPACNLKALKLHRIKHTSRHSAAYYVYHYVYTMAVYMGPNVAAFLANASCCPEKFISALSSVGFI
ncbi:uncharacterized protein LOC123327055 [Drosophila simulans]|uniref:uncharacterized protein LOC123327055 n=1 Tax=Drosophila simulans TaxID=7240 RepID=UPI001D0F9637|nr:uncharacterized protein LOC123327055 [Drosophila simulans]